MAFGTITLFFALVLDRLIGDPHSPYHPVALLGRLIGMWCQPNWYPIKLERSIGVAGWFLTVVVFFLLFFPLAWPSPWWYIQLPVVVVLLSFCFA